MPPSWRRFARLSTAIRCCAFPARKSRRTITSGSAACSARSTPITKKPADDTAGSDYRKGVMLVFNVRKDGKPIGNLPDGEMQFHSDGCRRDSPYLATALFADLYGAYDALSDELKAKIEGRRVRNVYLPVATSNVDFDPGNPDLPTASHPIVLAQPETGRKALFVNRVISKWIEGMDPAESEALMAALIAAAEAPERAYAHKWTAGDFLMWDNRCVTHARTDFPVDEVRLLRRYTISET